MAPRAMSPSFVSTSFAGATPLRAALPWPRGGALARLRKAVYADSSDKRGPDAWGHDLGMSTRPLTRRFEAELGINFRFSQRRLHLFKAVAFLAGGLSVTQTAMELSYGSTSAFVYAFRFEMEVSQ